MPDSPLVNQPAFSTEDSFSVMIRPCSDLVFPYHMHPDFQLNYVIEGKGKRVVGDHSEEYQSGDLVLIGPNLPHYWTYDDEFKAKNGSGKVIVVHFNLKFAGTDFIRLAETKPILEMLEKSQRGLYFTDHGNKRAVELLMDIENASSLTRLILLISALAELSQRRDFHYLAGPAYEEMKTTEQELKIRRIIHFISQHFNDTDICLEKLAGMASMSPTSFSKYFKKHTGQNYIEVLKGLRLSEASKLLGSTDLGIAQVASRCGFNNLSNFNKLFKKHYRCTPKQFADQVKKMSGK